MTKSRGLRSRLCVCAFHMALDETNQKSACEDPQDTKFNTFAAYLLQKPSAWLRQQDIGFVHTHQEFRFISCILVWEFLVNFSCRPQEEAAHQYIDSSN